MNATWTQFLQADRPFSIRSAGIPSTCRVLLLGPHPDDFDAVGVAMRFFQNNGHPVRVLAIRTGSGVEDAFCSPPTLQAKAALRDAEQRQSCRFFGLADESLTLLDLERDEQDQPRHCPANLDTLRKVILQNPPDFVFLPHGHDTNSGHRIVCAMFSEIVSRAGLPVAAFLIRDPKTVGMRIDCYVEFTEQEARWKAELLRCHASQHQRNLNTRNHGFDERILQVNRESARKLGIPQPYAEAFEIKPHNLPPASG